MQLPAEFIPKRKLVKLVKANSLAETVLNSQQIIKIESHVNFFADFEKRAVKKIESKAEALW